MTFYPIGMQVFGWRAAWRSTLHLLARQRARTIQRRLRRSGRSASAWWPMESTPSSSCPDPSERPRDPHEILCVGRASDPNKGIQTLIEALGCTPPARCDVFLTLVDDDHPENVARKRAAAARAWASACDIVGRVPTERAARALPPRRPGGGARRDTRASGCPPQRPWPAAHRWSPPAAGALPEVIATGGGGRARSERDDAKSARNRAVAEAAGSPMPERRQSPGARQDARVWRPPTRGPAWRAATAEVYAELALATAARAGRPEHDDVGQTGHAPGPCASRPASTG